MNITLDLQKGKESTLPLMEVWNPSMALLKNLEPVLEANRVVCLIWCYGEPEDMEDFSELSSSRFSTPYWLGRDKGEALTAYSQLGFRYLESVL